LGIEKEKGRKMMSKNMKLFLMVIVLVVLVAAVFMISTHAAFAAPQAGIQLNGFCVSSGSGSCGV